MQSGLQIHVTAKCLPVVGSADEPPRLVLQTTSLSVAGGTISVERIDPGKGANAGLTDGDLFQIANLDTRLGSAVAMTGVAHLRARANYFLPWELWEQYDVLADKVTEMLQICIGLLSDSEIPRSVISSLDGVSLDSPIGQEFRMAARRACRAGMERMPQSEGYQKAMESLQTCQSAGEWLRVVRLQLASSTRNALARDLIVELRIADKRKREGRSSRTERGFRSQPLPEPLNMSRNAVVEFFTSRIRYMGPLRDDPRAVYVLPPIPEDADVGTRGEYTAAVLQHHRKDAVACPIPGDTDFGSITLPLGEAVTLWLVHMGLVNNVATYDRGKIGTELALHVADLVMPVDLTNVGVGVSQVLPSVVMGLLAPQGSTLLLEQPELHLHPKVQSILGDFLIGLAHNGRQCIVESHSEYLVNRLRRRIAEAPGDSVQKLIQMYFVERTDGASVFRSVDPNEFGAIPDWPKGFFDQGPDEAQLIIQAATKKRQAKLDAQKLASKER